jgi:hypothetical protein
LTRRPFGNRDSRNRAWRARAVGAAILLSVLCVSCGAGAPTGAEDRAGAGTPAATFSQKGTALTVSLSVDPFPPRPMRASSFTLTLVDAQGAPVSGATVTCDMTMPAMAMPMNRPAAKEQSPGMYTAEVLFTMAGDWEAGIQVVLPDGASETFTFAMSTG